MPERIIIDLRRPLREFVRRLDVKFEVPCHVLDDVVRMVFDILIYEMEAVHDEPELHRLGNFYRDYLENDPIFLQRFLESFFLLLRELAGQLRSVDMYSGNGFSYAIEDIKNCRSIVVRRFES